VATPSGDSDNNMLRLALVECSEERVKHTSPSSHFSKSPEQTQNVYENKGWGWKPTTLTPSLSKEANLVLTPSGEEGEGGGETLRCLRSSRLGLKPFQVRISPEQTQNVYENKGSGWKPTTLTPSLSEEAVLVLPCPENLFFLVGGADIAFYVGATGRINTRQCMRHPHPFSWFLGARQRTGMSDCSDEERAGVMGPIRTQCHFQPAG